MLEFVLLKFSEKLLNLQGIVEISLYFEMVQHFVDEIYEFVDVGGSKCWLIVDTKVKMEGVFVVTVKRCMG
jgi:hypothetical protein